MTVEQWLAALSEIAEGALGEGAEASVSLSGERWRVVLRDRRDAEVCSGNGDALDDAALNAIQSLVRFLAHREGQ